MRTLPKLGEEIVEQIETAWKLPQSDWARKRLLVVRMVAQHEHTVAEIMKVVGLQDAHLIHWELICPGHTPQSMCNRCPRSV